ncbi:helix-turn-helix domain-containing protein [Mycobacterium colombiense]
MSTSTTPGRSNKRTHIAGLPRLLTLAEAADVSRLSQATLRRRISEGALAAHRVGPRLLRVELDSLLELIGSPIGVA